MKLISLAACSNCHKLNRFDPLANLAARCGKCHSLLPVQGALSDVMADDLQLLIQKSPLPVVVDFWASWCGPCQSYAPLFAEAAIESAGHAVFVKVDTEKSSGVSQQMGILGIPTTIIFESGMEKSRKSGVLTKDLLKNLIPIPGL